MGCGFCAAICPTKSVTMGLDAEKDTFIPLVKLESCKDCSDEDSCKCARFCPGQNLDMLALFTEKFGGLPENFMVGHHKAIEIGYAAESKLRLDSSSGGLVPLILRHLFETKKIAHVYCVVPSEESPYLTGGRLISSVAELRSIHGSVYHPINFGTELDQLLKLDEPFAFVGVPCQIQAIEKLKPQHSGVEKNLFLTIGIFCGGLNKYSGFAYYLKEFHQDWSNIKAIGFREGNWPGSIKVQDDKGNIKIVPRAIGNTRSGVLRYAASVDGYFMMPRCRMCPDQVSDLADIAVGDPHLPKYKNLDTPGYSILICRNNKGLDIIASLKSDGSLVTEQSSERDVIDSQGYTLDNRKHLGAYLKMNRLFLKNSPSFNLDQRAYTATLSHYLYAFRDLIKIYWFGKPVFRFAYKPLQILDYLFTSLLSPRKFIRRLRNVLFGYKRRA
jgi:coenzyme F420 hydrogenase subunit beta